MRTRNAVGRAPALPVATGKPSDEYQRHHDVEAPVIDRKAFRQGWRVRSRLDALHADKRITSAEWQAAVEYRQLWAVARELNIDRDDMTRIEGGGSSRDGAMIARLGAATKLRIVEERIGSEGMRLVRACVIHDISWSEIGRFWHRNPETVRDWTIIAIQALGEVWTT